MTGVCVCSCVGMVEYKEFCDGISGPFVSNRRAWVKAAENSSDPLSSDGTCVSYEYLQPLSCACVAGRRHGAPHHRVLGGARPSSVSAHEGQGRHRKAGPWRASGVRDCDCGAARCRVLPAEPRVRTESRDCVFHPTQVCLLITHATSAKTVARRMCSRACTRLPASPSTPSPAPSPA